MDFQFEKSFGKLRLRAFQPYHQILCILKHVGDVGDRSSTPKGCNAIYVGDVGDRNKSSIYIRFDGMAEKLIGISTLFEAKPCRRMTSN